jgi:hypothetical protein
MGVQPQGKKEVEAHLKTQGILYVATGEKYIRAAIRSAKTVLKYCPGLSTHLYADWQNHGFDFEKSPFPFASTAIIEDPHRRSKIDYLPRTPFDQTLYLDTDTALNSDIRGMFGILERFDVALNHAHRRNTIDRLAPWRLPLPQAFPQYNSGVFLYRKTPSVIRFLEDWSHHFKEAGFLQDQMTLRELLWLSDLRMATLPPEYNVRYIKYHYLWSKSEAETKIFHLQRYHTGWFWWIVMPWARRVLKLIRRLGFNPPATLLRRK